jgi:hypothetical protein
VAFVLNAGPPIFGFTCTPSGTCIVAASFAGVAVVYTTSDGGQTWTRSSVQ